MEISNADASFNSGTNPYLYNGKEIDRMHGANWYDYGARLYDPVPGRWHFWHLMFFVEKGQKVVE
jgi:RHS repeat-associated protein